MAEESSWVSVRLHHVATEMGLALEMIHRFYRQKDDLVEAWYDRADCAMLTNAVSVPMILNRDSNVFDAIQTSWTAVRYTFLQILLWAAILVVIILAWFVTFYVGL